MSLRCSKSLNLRSPLVIASGPGGFGEYMNVEGIDWKKVGAYTLKTVTYNPKEGNPPPRMYAKNGYLINRIGLENPGIDNFINLLENGYFDRLFQEVSVILSLGGDTYEEYFEITRKVRPHIGKFVAVEYNFSCPNVRHGGLSIMVDRDEWKLLLKEIRNMLPNAFLIAKLGIESGFVEENALLAYESGWEGVTLINTIRGLMFNSEGDMILGGLSGPNLLPIALRAVYEVRKKLSDIYIIASGGVYNPEDVDLFLKLGANAVSVGSALFKNEKILDNLIF
ncbi:MAG: HisA/HisF-related TIM barrel protein [Fervidobacterium sp.]